MTSMSEVRWEGEEEVQCNHHDHAHFQVCTLTMRYDAMWSSDAILCNQKIKTLCTKLLEVQRLPQ